MNRLLFISFFLIIGISLLTGCGGGTSPRLSTDYMGLEDGAVLIYNYSLDGTKYPHGARGTMPMTVEEYQPGIFKVGYDLFGDIGGHYIEKEGNSYYIRGDWETDEDPPSSHREKLLCINPLTEDFKNDRWGSFEKKEIITVPAGTFEAWKFSKREESASELEMLEIWFVPYLGEIKVIEIDKSGETETYKGEFALASYSFVP